jgi:hypothetical protein
MTAKGKRTFWVTTALTDAHHERIDMLRKNGFDVVLIPGLHEIVQHNAIQRASCVLFDTPQQSQLDRLQMIHQMTMMPEMNGVRFILIATQHSLDAYRMAVAEGFRDIIPLGLDLASWLQRVQFATGAKPSEFPAPLCEISMNQFAVATAPGRIIWISETHIRIECRGSQRIGSTLQITGPIAGSLGVNHISLTVESVHKDLLQFRFSQALVCRWRVPAGQSEHASFLIRRIPVGDQGPKLRAFVAATRADLRKNIITNLNASKFDIKVGLQRKTVAQELGYYSPNVIFLDDKLFENFGTHELNSMFSSVPMDVPVVIFGAETDRNRFAAVLGQRRLFIESEASKEVLQNAGRRFQINATSMAPNPGQIIRPIPVDHPWSKIDVLVPARLLSLNPKVGVISLPYSMGPFSLLKLEAPILRRAFSRDPYIKITNTIEMTSALPTNRFNHHAHFYLADVDRTEQSKLGASLAYMLNDYYHKQFSTNPGALPAQIATPIPAGTQSQTSSQASKSTEVEPLNQEINAHQKLIMRDLGAASPRLPKMRTKFSLANLANWRVTFDPILVKAFIVFIVAIGIMMMVLNVAMNIDDSFYRDHGREYSDFFQRMTNPEFRKNNPPPRKPRPNNEE